MGDTLGGYGAGRDVLAKAEVGQDADLAPGVYTFHVRGGICLGIALLLRFAQGLLKALAHLYHLGEDIVRGAVEYAAHGTDLVGRKALADGPQYRYTATDAGLEEEVHALTARERGELKALFRNQLLVGCDHALAGFQAALVILVGQRRAAYALGHHLDLRVVGDSLYVVDNEICKRMVGPGLAAEDVFYLYLTARPACDEITIFGKHFHRAAAHDAYPEYCNFDHIFSPSSLSRPGRQT